MAKKSNLFKFVTLKNPQLENKVKTVAAVKGGRCYNGFHRDAGKVVHAVTPLPENTGGYWGNKSLCGTEPGGRSYGWTTTDKDVNCPKCIKKKSND